MLEHVALGCLEGPELGLLAPPVAQVLAGLGVGVRGSSKDKVEAR